MPIVAARDLAAGTRNRTFSLRPQHEVYDLLKHANTFGVFLLHAHDIRSGLRGA